MHIERRQRVRRWGPALISGSAALLAALLGLSTNVASALISADWAESHRRYVWAATVALALVTAVLAAVAAWPRRDPAPEPPSVVRGEPLASYRAASVQSLIPSDGLRDRDQELRELAEFTRGDGCYLSVRAPAYGGKTALLAAFVTHPPPDVEIVSYFIVGRIASQSTRLAFVDAVLDQLSELSGDRRALPDEPSAREAYLLTRLRADAAALARTGRGLVLVVDGLDEDRGAGAGPNTASIAALLPRHALPGLRVIVSSRSGRPLSSDVPGDHPLRRAETFELAPYRGAEADRDAARQELQRLLTGSELARDMLGLVVAAGGRLTRDDLAELTGRAPFELDPVLEGATGRSFAYHEAAADGVGSGAGYLLAHDTLQVEAVEKFGAERLRGYRERLAGWAGDYRRRGWPGTTPRYLLIDYPQMLYAAGEADLLFRLAVDVVRRARLFESSGGGDHAALGELRLARELMVVRESPDLASIGVVTLHHEYVYRRNQLIPVNLPAAWFDLGERVRAFALAHSIPDPYGESYALTSIAISIAEKGDTAAAVGLVQAIPNGRRRASAARGLAATMAGRGDLDTAETLLSWADQVDDRDGLYNRDRALAEVAHAAVRSGQATAAERYAVRIHDQYTGVRTCVSLARLAAERADLDRARRFLSVAQASALAEEPPNVYELAEIVGAAADVFGLGPDLTGYLAEAERTARLLAASKEDDTKIGELVRAVADAGDPDRARRLLPDARGDYDRKLATTGILRGLAATGRGAEAERMLAEIPDDQKVSAIVAVIEGASRADDHRRVSALGCAVADRLLTGERSELRWGLVDESVLVSVLVRAGELDRAEALVEATRQEPGYDLRFGNLVTALIARGDGPCAMSLMTPDRIKRFDENRWDQIFDALLEHESPSSVAHFVRGLESIEVRASGFTKLARSAIARGAIEDARGYAELATQDARALSRGPEQDAALLELAEALGGAGDYGRVRAVVRAIQDPFRRALGLISLLSKFASASARSAAHAGIEEILVTCRSVADRTERLRILANLAAAVKSRGWEAQFARMIVLGITDPHERVRALAAIVDSLPASQRDELLSVAENAFRQAAGASDLLTTHGGMVWTFDLLHEMATILHGLGGPERLVAFVDSLGLPSQSETDAMRPIEMIVDSAVQMLAHGGDLAAAEAMARTIPHHSSRSSALGNVAEAWADRGDFDRAMSIAADMTDEIIQGGALRRIAERLIAAGDFSRAEEAAAGAMRHWPDKAQTLTAVARAVYPTDPPRARELLAMAEAEVPGPTHIWVGDPLQVIAVAWHLLGDTDHALAIVDSLREEDALSTVAALFAWGDGKNSYETVRRFADAAVRASARKEFGSSFRDSRGTIARGLLEHGLDEQARALFEDGSSYADRHRGRAELTELLAETAARRGERRHAEEIAFGVSDDGARAALFVRLSELTRATDPTYSKRLLSHALALRPWGPAWRSLLADAPEAVPALADEYLALWESPRPEAG